MSDCGAYINICFATVIAWLSAEIPFVESVLRRNRKRMRQPVNSMLPRNFRYTSVYRIADRNADTNIWKNDQS